MGIFKLNGIDYMGGGSGGNIQPGLGYKETVLWEDTSGASPSSAITLSSALNNYDAIYIITASNAEPNYRSTQIIPVSAIDTTGTTNFGIFDTGANNYYYVVLNYVDSTHITLSSWGSSYPIKYYKVVGINYGAGGTPIQPIIYSEEEREVGVWTDGKPLYQKTWIYTATSVITSSTVIGNYDANTVEIKAISSQATEGTTDYLLPYVSGGGGYSSITTLNGDILLAVSNASWGNGSIIKVTIQYTKTTDTPGSGTWTPQGVPAVHYSTEEQVIGTWVDGSTLYEKTIVSNDSLPYRTWTTIFSETGANIHRWEGKIYINSTKTQSLHLDYHRGEGTTHESCCTMESNNAIKVSQSIINGTTYGYELTVQYTKS